MVAPKSMDVEGARTVIVVAQASQGWIRVLIGGVDEVVKVEMGVGAAVG